MNLNDNAINLKTWNEKIYIELITKKVHKNWIIPHKTGIFENLLYKEIPSVCSALKVKMRADPHN